MHPFVLRKVLSKNEATVVFEILHSLCLVSHEGKRGFDSHAVFPTRDDRLSRALLEGFEIRIKLKIVGVLVLELLTLWLAEVLVDVVLHVGLSVDPRRLVRVEVLL